MKKESKYLSPSEAAKIHEENGFGTVGAFTIVYWCKQYGIGKKIGGRWKVNKAMFEKLLTGGTYVGNPKT